MAGLAGLLFLGLVVWAGGGYHPLFSLVLAGLVAVVVLVPDSGAPLFLMLGLGGLWAVSVPETLSAWAVLAALDLLVLHLACTLASYGPPQVVLDRALFLLWAGRASLMAAAAVTRPVADRSNAPRNRPPSQTSTAAAAISEARLAQSRNSARSRTTCGGP